MTSLAYAALVFALAGSSPVQRAVAHDAPLLLSRTAVAQTEEGDEEDAEEDVEEGEGEGEEGSVPTGTGTSADVPPGSPATATPAPSTMEGAEETPPPAQTDARSQQLVSGAPLFNPNVAVHIVQKKQFTDKGKHELSLFPAVAQVNGKFTSHYGTALAYTYHLHENFGFQLMPQFNWYNTESDFNQELITKVREEAQAASSLLLNWGVLGGVEVAPLYGKFAWYENSLAQYALILTGGAGYGSTRHQLKPQNEAGPATFGDTGNRFIGSVGGGFRVLLGDRFAIRAEIRDIVYTARVDQVNGCGVTDLKALDDASRANRALNTVQVSEGCNWETFEGTDDSGFKLSSNIPLAYNLVRDPTSDVLNLVSFYGGISFIF